jgi:hypothetical protein
MAGVTVTVSPPVGLTYWYCRLQVDITQGEMELGKMHAHSGDLQRGTGVDRCTADAVLR